jgi:hypothetical protein
VFGAEYRATSAIGVHAEYRAAVMYTSQTLEQRNLANPSVQRTEASAWMVSSGGVRFGLSAYF